METKSLELWSTDKLVEAKNGQAVTSSLVVAEYFRKAHKDVLKAIRGLECSANFTERNFAPCVYINELCNNVKKELPMYHFFFPVRYQTPVCASVLLSAII